MKLQHEIPAAVIGLLDEKHQEELDQLLLQMYEYKAGELRNLMLALVEEKALGSKAIEKNFRQRALALDAIGQAIAQGGELDECSKEQIENDKAKLRKDEQKELMELDRDLGTRKSERERDLTVKALARENRLVDQLQREQLAERKTVLEEKLHGVLIIGLLEEMNEEEEAGLAVFKKEQEEAVKK